MILKSYELTNWGPHRHQKIVFPAGVKTIALVAENDQGKSWVLRGIGFTLSIGRNEYGDQTAIHDGQTDATHKLVIEHNGQEHTIEKTVRGKNAEEEGTTTFINGTQTDRAGFEAWYASTLGLPHPSIWLPIIIAMQNETDFHLRKKKAEREEALRAACRLTKIDNWKDALQARTNEEDKTLIALVAELKAQIEGISKETASLENELGGLKERITKEENPFGEGGLTLKEISLRLRLVREAISTLKKNALEEENHKRELTLAENSLARLEAEIKNLPGGSPAEEEECQKLSENIEQELQGREKIALEVRIARCETSLAKKEKRICELTEIKQSTAESLEATLAALMQSEKSLEETKKAIAENPHGKTPVDELQKEIADLEEKENQLKGERTRMLEAGKNLEETLKNARRHWEEIPSEDPEAELGKISALLQSSQEFGAGPIGKEEAEFLTLRILEHWEDHPADECPICSRSLAGLSSFTDPKKRRILLAGLQEEATNAEEAKAKRTRLGEALTELKIATRAKEKLKALLAWPNWKEAASKKTEEITAAETLRKSKEAACGLIKNMETLESKRFENQEALTKTHKEATTQEAARKIAAEIRASGAECAKEKAEAAGLEKEIAETKEKLSKLPNTEKSEPEGRFSQEETAALEKDLIAAKEKLKEFRTQRTARTNKEQEVGTAKIKLQALQEKSKTLAETKAEAEKTTKENTIPSTEEQNPEGQTPEEAAALIPHWENREQIVTGLRARIAPIQEKLAQKTKEKEEKEEEFTATEKRVAKAAAARKLIAFLDYKNAPRKLLASICERLFATTNKIGEILEVDIRVKVGKNLDFLTIQKRNGRIIEQKTERLGFGKGAILGICFRLACQKILLPETGFLILDEPTANVDTKRKSALKAFLQNLSQETESGTKQIILVEHDEEVTGLCGARIPIGELAQETQP